MEELIQIHSLMRAMETANPDVHDARRPTSASIGWSLDRRRKEGQCLAREFACLHMFLSLLRSPGDGFACWIKKMSARKIDLDADTLVLLDRRISIHLDHQGFVLLCQRVQIGLSAKSLHDINPNAKAAGRVE